MDEREELAEKYRSEAIQRLAQAIAWLTGEPVMRESDKARSAIDGAKRLLDEADDIEDGED